MTSTSPVTAPTSTAPLTVEVWSDVVCPWCYIGKRRLEAALDRLALPQVRVVWRSFQLDPSAPRPGEPGHGQDVAEHLGEKYGGGREAGLRMSAQMTEVAAAEGLVFRLEDAGRGSTVDAHRLLHLAADVEAQGAPGLQDAVKERLLRAYFTEGADVSDPRVLRRLAVEAGLPAVRVDEVLGSDEYAPDVLADQAQARAYGASGVPFTVVDGRYGISGAQPVEVFVDALTRARADRTSTLVPVTADDGTEGGCGPDGCAVPGADQDR
jgi:predicted DsbA family dithiol-disulfide isomerase